MAEPRTAWDDVRDLLASVGHEARFEHVLRPRPPLVCEPVTEYLPDEDGTAWVYCTVHQDEGWPCQAFREGRGVTPQEPHWVNQFVTRPVAPGPTYGFAASPDLLFTEPEGDDG